ncbi:MAG TPA: pyridoxal phosphate-dependent aminotransferase [Ktedonobacterales bacterium]|jgi:histidinol-phosphate aminotransferase
MRNRAPFTRLVAELPATVPFVAPEALERQSGRPIKLRLGANESTFGPSPRAREAMRAAADQVAWYGDPESYVLREALARHHRVSMDQIVVGSGIDDLLGLIVRAFLEHGEVAVTSLGAYPTFNYHVAGYGGSLERVPYRNNTNDLQALAAAASRVKARLVYLANPDNPTGSWHSAHDLQAFLESLPDDCLLLLDEAYSDFAPAEAIAQIDADDPRMLRLRTFSKAHGMAGARIGYAIGSAETISAFEKIRLHFGVNLVAQAGALASLEDTDYLQAVMAEVSKGRQDYEKLAHSLGLPTIPSATNFVSLDVGGPERASALLAALAEHDVFVRVPGVSPLNRCIRVTVGRPEERAAFAAVLREVWPTIASVGGA